MENQIEAVELIDKKLQATGIQLSKKQILLLSTKNLRNLEQNVSLTVWYISVIDKLVHYRGLVIPENTKNFILNELIDRGFSYHNRLLAEIWILRGNWTYKSPKTLTVNDFYPKKDDFGKSIEMQDIVATVDLENLRKETEAIFRKKYLNYVESYNLKQKFAERNKSDKYLIKMCLQCVDLETENANLKEKLKKALEKIEEIKQKIIPKEQNRSELIKNTSEWEVNTV